MASWVSLTHTHRPGECAAACYGTRDHIEIVGGPACGQVACFHHATPLPAESEPLALNGRWYALVREWRADYLRDEGPV